jgi:hypothetical protein
MQSGYAYFDLARITVQTLPVAKKFLLMEKARKPYIVNRISVA